MGCWKERKKKKKAEAELETLATRFPGFSLFRTPTLVACILCKNSVTPRGLTNWCILRGMGKKLPSFPNAAPNKRLLALVSVYSLHTIRSIIYYRKLLAKTDSDLDERSSSLDDLSRIALSLASCGWQAEISLTTFHQLSEWFHRTVVEPLC